MKSTQTARVGIIGGGLGGLAAAMHARRPRLSGRSCSSETIGSGARRPSWKNRAIASTWGRRY